MPLKTDLDGDIVILTPTRTGDPNPDRVIIMAREEIRRLIAEQARKVIVDCGQIDFLSSTEVGAMIGAMREINQVQGALIFTGIGVRLAEIFEVMRILQVLPIRLTTREAQVELQKIRTKEPNLIAKLTTANPTLADINAWCDGQIAVTVNPKLTRTPEPHVRPEEETLFGHSAPRPIPAENKSPADTAPDPWNHALQIIRSAQSLSESQGLPFSPSMTFQEFLGNLSLKLPPK
jgi:anti-anti-sigma factor